MSNQYPPNPPQWMAVAQGPPRPTGRNGMAIASLILGILGICGLSLVLGLILGIIALVQINRTGQPGRGMAIAGIVLSLLWAGGLAVGVVYVASKAKTLGTTPTIVGLQVGECYDTPPGFGADATKVPCTGPHDGEVFDTVPLKGYVEGEYPGEEYLESQAKPACEAKRAAKFGAGHAPPVEAELGVFYPDSAAWKARKFTAACTLQVTSDTRFTAPLAR
ncbi:DUF4190 domain-containing protein [Amycolatopsis sp. SID8362]|uniref:DUF4190 domain-containing protein n=1 Tax=Amycolatopsis sp. SID8362 TaxID=2690346 RepID=UPI001943E91D|nr:DUF4190 domain-containing protein [Amycolatopsis sp. SID8362]